MTKSTSPSYLALDQALSKTSLKLHASQAHGLVCGIVCGSTSDNTEWEKLIAGENEPKQTHEVLQEVYNMSQNQLEDFLFEFELVLPDDDVDLPERAEALTLWAQGFLTGLKMVGVTIVDRDPSDLTEAINDIIEIAKMNFEQVIASEEDEVAYSDLVEYVRMAVILIYQELRHPGGKAGPISTHLH
jgi:uncharacterized protein